MAIRITSDVAREIEPLISADIDAEHRRTLAHGLVGLAEQSAATSWSGAR